MFTHVHTLRAAIPASAAAIALLCAPAALGAGAAAPATADPLAPPVARTQAPAMPVETTPNYLAPGSHTPDSAPVTLGTDSATVTPGSTAGTTVVPPAAPGLVGTPPAAAAAAPVRVTCRRGAGSRRIRCVARSEGRIVTRCSYRSRRIASLHISLCRTSAKRRLSTGAKSAAISWQGFPRQTAPAVGALYYQGRQICTATVVSPTLVLTAAHCIWSGGYLDINQVRFAPGQTWGNPAVPTSVVHPYGLWAPSKMWSTSGYTRGDFSADFALLEIPPLNDGRRISDLVGAYSVTPNISWQAGTRAYLMGYPTVGYWSTAQALHGRGQYACDSSWSGRYQRDGSGWSYFTDCAMNQGASGGPWFLLVNNRWTIGGVNSRCTAYPTSPPKVCLPWAKEMITSYVGDTFTSFWSAVQPQLSYR